VRDDARRVKLSPEASTRATWAVSMARSSSVPVHFPPLIVLGGAHVEPECAGLEVELVARERENLIPPPAVGECDRSPAPLTGPPAAGGGSPLAS
jgi:hypothetical protein